MKESNLLNKKILYITTPFFEYPQKIKESIEKQGGHVSLCYFNIKSIKSTFLLNFNSNCYKRFRINQENKIFSSIKTKTYDYVLIQHPYSLSHDFHKNLKENFKHAIFINYNWDSLRTGNYLEYSQYYDKILSFDRADVESNQQILYHPLFYTNDFVLNNENRHFGYDLSFIGIIGISVNRYEFLEKIQFLCNELGLNFYKYLYISRNRYIKTQLLKKKKAYSGLKHKKLSLDDIAKIYSNSKVIIDYNNPLQSGLTMRTFEVLGSGKKLITTNKNIAKEPFYNKESIAIIDPLNPKIDPGFIDNKTPNTSTIIKNYHIDYWVNKLFNFD